MRKPYQQSAKETRALQVFFKLSRATESVASNTQKGLAESELTSGQLGVLEALLELGPVSQRELGRRLLRSDPNMTTVVDNLEKARLVRRSRSTEDRRVVLVAMTTEGKRKIEWAFPPYAEKVAEFLSVLTKSEQEELSRLCDKLVRDPT